MHHNFLVVTVKKGLKSVYIYRSYYKNKLGGPFCLDHPVDSMGYLRSLLYPAFSSFDNTGA